MSLHPACSCFTPSRRLFTLALLGAAGATGTAQAAIPECKRSGFTKAVSADQVESGAQQQYRQMLQDANNKRALLSGDEQQVQRLRYIARRIIPFTPECNDRARNWQWEVNVLASRTVNAFCMPGGKIAFYYGILSELQLDDDETAMIMGHEVAHALLEHARERFGKNVVTSNGLRALSAVFGLGQLGDIGAQVGANLLSLKFSRDDESEADRLGLIMAASAGYDPRKGVTLWRKMTSASGSSGKPPGWLSTHPAGTDRISDIESRLPQVMPIFESANKPDRRFAAPAKLPPDGGGNRQR